MKTKKQLNIDKREEALMGLPMPELRERFAVCYGHSTTSRNRVHLVHRILWAEQRDAFGGISEAARNKALAMADDRDAKERFAQAKSPAVRDAKNTVTIGYHSAPNLLPGTVLHREYQGTDVRVLVLEKGFEWNGEFYKSLSAVARAITGTRWNGKLFFGLKKTGGNA
ncbi:DUF2924 domain-containing protein [Pontiellaceae bacterium B12219]|nr:DUF2924 domain-containing protein [Pontiellaceae bacterium B12219]